METPRLDNVCRAALELQAFCREKEWRFCFIGGLALLAWAEPQATLGADITLLTGFGDEGRYADALLSRFHPRRSDAHAFSLQYRVLLLRTENHVGLDIGFGALPFEAHSIGRSVEREIIPGCRLQVCCAEDLVVHKVFASRDQDWADVDKILMRQGSRLDLTLVFQELRPLIALKEDASILPRLENLLAKRGLQVPSTP
jgi:hypothetical protein